MIIDGCEIMVDNFTKFHDCLYIYGWFYHPTDTLKDVRVLCNDCRCVIAKTGLDHGGVRKTRGPNLGFSVQLMSSAVQKADDVTIALITKSGAEISVNGSDLCADRLQRYETFDLSKRFFDMVNAGPEGTRMLDVGGRDRSRVDRRHLFPRAEVTVLDILEGENVDIVADAHTMSSKLDRNIFDYVISVSVFEHLLMPWKVAIEIGKVLKPGGYAYIHTHQTIGLHDSPWDFFRFSSDCWPSLFNARTGFEILESKMDVESFILPFILRPGKEDAEKSAGCESSAVLVRKISEPSIEWDISVSDLIQTSYPTTPDSGAGHLVPSSNRH